LKNNTIFLVISVAVIAGFGLGVGISTILESDDNDVIITKDISHILDVQIPALTQTHKIQSDLLEGVEEAFAYVILDDVNEKNEFFKKMDDFEKRVNYYIIFSADGQGDDDAEQIETLNKIIKVQKNLVASATVMFESFESGSLDLKTVQAFEDDIDAIVPLVDKLIEEEIEDIKDHVYDIDDVIDDD